MDSITQAVLGASIQGALLGRWQGRKALLYGAILGTLPDLDVVLDYGDAVANMTYHRGFSHSLLVLSVVSVLLAWAVRRFRPHPEYSGVRLWFCIWLILITHVLLDAFTDRKSTRLNSSHVKISYAVFCLKKKKQQTTVSYIY